MLDVYTNEETSPLFSSIWSKSMTYGGNTSPQSAQGLLLSSTTSFWFRSIRLRLRRANCARWRRRFSSTPYHCLQAFLEHSRQYDCGLVLAESRHANSLRLFTIPQHGHIFLAPIPRS